MPKNDNARFGEMYRMRENAMIYTIIIVLIMLASAAISMKIAEKIELSIF